MYDLNFLWVSPLTRHQNLTHPLSGYPIGDKRVVVLVPPSISRKESRICGSSKCDQPSDNYLVRRNKRSLFTSEILQKDLGTWEFNQLYLQKCAEVIFIKYLALQREHCCTNMSCCFEHKQSRNQILSSCCILSQGDSRGFTSMYLYLIINTQHQGSQVRAEL